MSDHVNDGLVSLSKLQSLLHKTELIGWIIRIGEVDVVEAIVQICVQHQKYRTILADILVVTAA